MLLYNIGVRLYGTAIRAASLRSEKASEWVKGRRSWRQNLRKLTGQWDSQRRIWVHCASYGEFEQGRPVIEQLRDKFPRHRIILTFFSPSGFMPFREWKGADLVFYLPLDTPANASEFLDIVSPSVAIFIKYEFWLNYLREIRQRQIPCYLVSAVFKQHQPFFRWYGVIFRKSLATFRTLFIQDDRSGHLLESIGIRNYRITGDTRFDRVIQIRKEKIEFGWLDEFRNGQHLIVAGSTWASDDEFLLVAFKKMGPGVKLVLVPHDVDERSLERVTEKITGSHIPFSIYSRGIRSESRLLLLDTVGMLSRVYAYAHVAYVGGGFDGGIHNSLEPAVFGVPITFYGNDYTKFNEAVELLSKGAAVNVKTADELVAAWNRFLDPEHSASVTRELERYFADKGDASMKVVEGISLTA